MQKVTNEWKLISKSHPKKISTTSTHPNVLPLTKGNTMSIDKLNEHTTTKAIISTYAEALYSTKLNVSMKKLNLIIAYQKLGTQPTGQPSAPAQAPLCNPQPSQHPNTSNWTIHRLTRNGNKEVMCPFNGDTLKLVQHMRTGLH